MEKSNLVYMCPITKQSYNNPIQPRLNYLANQWELTPDEIFEYCCLKEELEAQQEEVCK